MYILQLIVLVISILSVSFLIPVIINRSEKAGRLDIPDHRKIHTTRVSRLGGITFAPTMLVAVGIALLINVWLDYSTAVNVFSTSNAYLFCMLFVSILPIFVAGVYDDLYGLGYKPKFLAQFLSAVILCLSFFLSSTGMSYYLAIIIFLVVYIINSINLIDGIDGLASGISIISLVFLMVSHALVHDMFGFLIATATLGAVCTFFYFNVLSHSRKIFMGDTGSMTLGFIISYLVISLFFNVNCQMSSLFDVLLITCISSLVIPMFDVLRVMLVRICHGRNPFLADKGHIHHLLMDSGLTPRQTLTTLLLFDLFIALFTFLLLYYLLIM